MLFLLCLRRVGSRGSKCRDGCQRTCDYLQLNGLAMPCCKCEHVRCRWSFPVVYSGPARAVLKREDFQRDADAVALHALFMRCSLSGSIL